MPITFNRIHHPHFIRVLSSLYAISDAQNQQMILNLWEVAINSDKPDNSIVLLESADFMYWILDIALQQLVSFLDFNNFDNKQHWDSILLILELMFTLVLDSSPEFPKFVSDLYVWLFTKYHMFYKSLLQPKLESYGIVVIEILLAKILRGIDLSSLQSFQTGQVFWDNIFELAIIVYYHMTSTYNLKHIPHAQYYIEDLNIFSKDNEVTTAQEYQARFQSDEERGFEGKVKQITDLQYEWQNEPICDSLMEIIHTLIEKYVDDIQGWAPDKRLKKYQELQDQLVFFVNLLKKYTN